MSRVQVELSATRLSTDAYGDPLAALQVDNWDQLSDTGVLSGKLLAATGGIVLPRTITAVNSSVVAYNSITTAAGANAYDDLASIGAHGSLAIGTLVAEVGTAGQTLVNSGSLTFFSGTTWQVHTAIVNDGVLQFLQPGTIDGAVTNDAAGSISGGLQAPAVTNAGRIDVTTTVTAATYAQSRGRTTVETAAQLRSTGLNIKQGGLQVGLYSVVDAGGGRLTLGRGATLSGTQFTCRANIVGDMGAPVATRWTSPWPTIRCRARSCCP